MLKHADDFLKEADDMLKKVMQFNKIEEVEGQLQIMDSLASVLHSIWLDGYNDGFLDSSKVKK